MRVEERITSKAEKYYRSPNYCVGLHLDIRSLMLLPEGKSTQEVEKPADLLGCEVVHVVQDPLCQTVCRVEAKQIQKNNI